MVVELLSRYVSEARSAQAAVIHDRDLSEIDAHLDWRKWVKEGGMRAQDVAAFVERFLTFTTRLHHPSFLAHQVAVPDEGAAIADLVNGVLNNGMAIYEMGPPGVALERGMVRWMLSKVGWAGGDGTLTHGGSVANLTCLLAARARVAPEVWRKGVHQGELVVIATPSCHYSISRTIGIMGLGEDALLRLPADRFGVAQAEALAPMLDEVRSQGRKVLAVVANGCSTSTGLHDPIAAMADACHRGGVWFHVDAAHGGGALLSPRLREYLAGIEHADSMVWDAHKMLRTSVLCAAALFRNKDNARAAFQQEAIYFSDVEDERENVFEKALECTKTGLGLKLFLVLARLGEDGLREYVETMYERAREYHALLVSMPGFECPYEPESNILCFRYRDLDQEALRHGLMAEGSYYLGGTDVDGVRHLRLCVMNPETDEGTIRGLVERLEVLGRVIGAGS